MKTVLVNSIKGGTGKSIISLNLALELAKRGYKVGFLDADIESSYFAEYTGVNKSIEVSQDEIIPVDWNGIKVFSMSLLIGKDRAVSMYGFSERQLLNDVKNRVRWGDIDVLIIDMPSGAGDVFKEVIELWADTIVGGVIVIIPMAHLAGRRLIRLYQLNEVPIIGLIENMAYFKCPKCGTEYEVFGKRMGKKLAEETGVTFLGEIPLDPRIPEGISKGDPRIPEDINEPIIKTADAVEMMEPGKFYEKFKSRIASFVKNQVIKLVAQLIILANKTFDIGELQRKYKFNKQYPILLAITDGKGNMVAGIVVRVKDGKLVVVKKKVEPRYIIEVPVKTLAQLILGYREVDGKKVPFDVYDAWSTGELKVYGEGSTPMLLYVAKTLLTDEDVNKNIREKFGKALELLAR